MASSSPDTSKLHIAVSSINDDVTEVKKLLSSGKWQINKPDSQGVTALMRAAQCGNVKITTFLIMNGANIILVDRSGMNVLHHAIDYGAINVVKLLLAQFPTDTERQKKLINAKTLQGVTPLILAAKINFTQAFKLLVESKADLNSKTHQGFTALHYAASKKYSNIVSLLINNEVDLDSQSANGSTPLILATKGNHIYIVGCLVNSHADVNIANIDGNTPAHIASKRGYLEIMTCLVKQGHCNLSAENKEKQTPLELSIASEHHDVRDFIQLQQPASARKIRHGRQVKSRKELTYDTMKNIQKASVQNVKVAINDSYLTLSEIKCTIRQKRCKHRKPLSSLTHWDEMEPVRLESDGLCSTILRGEKHTNTSSTRSRTTLGAVEQSQITSESDTDESDQSKNEIDCEIIQRTKAMEENVKDIEKELRGLTADSGNISPCSDSSSDGSWADIFRHPSHQFVQKLFDRINMLHMQIESLHSTVRTCISSNGWSTCFLQDADHGKRLFHCFKI